jgi:pilus assembly protein CpaF
LEMLVGMAAPELPMSFIHRQIASAIHIVVQTTRVDGGSRKITQIAEIVGTQGDAISMHDIFTFEQTDVNRDGQAEGNFAATGIYPHCLSKLERAGIYLPRSTFERGVRGFDRGDALLSPRG